MSVIETGERIAKEIDEKIDGNVVSAVVFGTDIRSEPKEGMDCNIVLILDKIDHKTLLMIDHVVKDSSDHCMITPILVEVSEIEGMMDSVPHSFLDILVSYQTVYGRSLFKGLSSINHEHLRAQIEQSLREYLFNARRRLFHTYSMGSGVVNEIEAMRALLNRSVQLYCILVKPWLTQEGEKWESFFEDFQVDEILLKGHYRSDIGSLSDEDLRKLGFSIIDQGIKPILRKIDEMGPTQ
ncbi:MAG: hypothetical protein JXA22_04430 [Candidatus Thermoplasmatota archaeon]|nr:hypothetical protein [Candidatus Thermoplasmatota archaeon]